jgi:hypothetical protein
MNPAGGQYSSLKDMVRVMQSFLKPSSVPGSVLSEYTLKEWMRPLHIWADDLTESGAPWEIKKVAGGKLGTSRFYSKGGNLPGYRSEFAINPSYSYGIIALMTGPNDNILTILNEIIDRFQPAFEKIQARAVKEAYAGRWRDKETNSEAIVQVSGGSIVLKKLMVKDVDILGLVQQKLSAGKKERGKPVLLWDTGIEGEFRLAFGRPGLNEGPVGCFPYWVTFDFAMGHGAPIDFLHFKDGKLVYPSANVTLSRT